MLSTTRYSSLNLLTQIKPDFVKFDRELVRFIDEEPYKQKVLGKLIEMARDLGVQTLRVPFYPTALS